MKLELCARPLVSLNYLSLKVYFHWKIPSSSLTMRSFHCDSLFCAKQSEFQVLEKIKKFSLFFAIFEKFSLRFRFALGKRNSLRFRFAKKLKKNFAFASLSHLDFGGYLDPWLGQRFQRLFLYCTFLIEIGRKVLRGD